ncbi:MAG: hypothetical protein Q8O22_06590 [Candidatus Omnitrophota bacterium]|nr:hypothetical protein [Candidatus Omnitrophota bacterium]
MGKITGKLPAFFFSLGAIFVLAGCMTAPPSQLTPLQRRVMESKELEGSFDDAFRATIAVLQDKGYLVKTSDRDGGLVYAESGLTNAKDYWFGLGNYQYKVTVNFEKFTETRTKIRLSIATEIYNITGGPWPMPTLGDIKAGPVDDPRMYQDLYAEIQKEMFRRAQLNK